MILLLHPGEMGASIGRALNTLGHATYWVPKGRSSVTHERAESAGLQAASSLREGLQSASYVFSICPPGEALNVAQEIAAHDFSGVYVDANATAPTTAAKIAQIFGDQHVDGGIIGPSVSKKSRTSLYFSGTRANNAAALLNGAPLEVTVLEQGGTAASALKMCYASYTKGTSALLLALRSVAAAHGVTEALLAEWEMSQPGLAERSARAAPGTSRKGWRFAAEMREIASTYEDAGLPGGFHLAAADIFERMTPFKDQPAATLETVISTLRAEHE